MSVRLSTRSSKEIQEQSSYHIRKMAKSKSKKTITNKSRSSTSTSLTRRWRLSVPNSGMMCLLYFLYWHSKLFVCYDGGFIFHLCNFFFFSKILKKKSLLTWSISEDVKYWAEFQTGIKAFDPWLKKAEGRKTAGLKTPSSLVEACEILGDAKVV